METGSARAAASTFEDQLSEQGGLERPHRYGPAVQSETTRLVWILPSIAFGMNGLSSLPGDIDEAALARVRCASRPWRKPIPEKR